MTAFASAAAGDLFPPAPPRHPVSAFVRRRPAVAVGGLLLGLVVLAALFAPWLGTADPLRLNTLARARVPSAQHWFGTDPLGRDLYSRVLYGARVSLVVGLAVALLACAAGLLVGTLSGYLRRLDGVLMRVMDGLMSIPPILLAIALASVVRGSLWGVVLAIAVAETPRVARLVRGIVLTLREQPFVEAAIAAGTRTPMLLARHIVPNLAAPMTVQATYICASAMVIEAILSFIGAGTPPSIPSWGNIMADGRGLWQVKPHLVLIPAAFLSLTVLAVNLLGDGLRDWLDPAAARRA